MPEEEEPPWTRKPARLWSAVVVSPEVSEEEMLVSSFWRGLEVDVEEEVEEPMPAALRSAWSLATADCELVVSPEARSLSSVVKSCVRLLRESGSVEEEVVELAVELVPRLAVRAEVRVASVGKSGKIEELVVESLGARKESTRFVALDEVELSFVSVLKRVLSANDAAVRGVIDIKILHWVHRRSGRAL